MSRIKFLFLPFLLFVLLSDPTSFIDADEQKNLNLNISNGDIFLEVRRNKTCGDGQGSLLICYPSKTLNFNGKAKASRCFQLIDQGNENFAPCRKLTGPHNGLLINFQEDELNIKTSFNKMGFSCSMESNNQFGIHLRGGASLLSSLMGCADKTPCDAVYKLGEFFNRTMWEAHQVPYVDDFGPLWYLGLDMLASNATKNGQIKYFWQCPWTVEFSNVSKSTTCGEKVPTTSASTHSARRSTPTTKSTTVTTKDFIQFGTAWFNQTVITIVNTNQSESVNYTSRIHHLLSKFEPFRVKLTMYTYEIACNRTILNQPSHAYMWEQACNLPDPQNSCHSENTVSLYICYDSFFAAHQDTASFSLKNLPSDKNNVSKICNTENDDGKIQHGFGVTICALRKNGTHLINATLHLSYSNKTYQIASIPRSIEDNGFGSEAQEPVHLGTIQFGPLATYLFDANGAILNGKERPIPPVVFNIGPNDRKYPIETLADSYADILPIKQADGLWMRKLRLIHSKEEHVCLGFKPIETNGKQIALRGCEAAMTVTTNLSPTAQGAVAGTVPTVVTAKYGEERSIFVF